MQLRDFHYFVAVADANGFRRAGRQLGVRQSALSLRIRNLEDELGVSLLERHSGGVRLTNAGSCFLHDLRAVFALLESAIGLVRAHGQAKEGRLSIGIVASISTSFANRLLRQWITQHPQVQIDLIEASSQEHIAGIITRRLDIALVTGTPSASGCDVERLWSEPILAALPSVHALTSRGAIDLIELASERFLIDRHPRGREIHDFIMRRLSGSGVGPHVVEFTVARETLMSLVGIGLGISLVSGAEIGIVYPNVTFVPIGGEALPFSAVWSPENDNPALRRFLSTARAIARQSQADDAPSKACGTCRDLSHPARPE